MSSQVTPQNMPGQPSDMPPDEAQAALAWLVEMGADEVARDEPIDRFAASMAKPAVPKMEPPVPASDSYGVKPNPNAPLLFPEAQKSRSSAAKPPSQSDGAADARALAASCNTLEEIVAALQRFDACPLKKTATNLCFSDGNPRARLMLIGEAPGRDEDIQGKPFVGRAGQLLDKMLAAIHLSRTSPQPESSVFITNTVFWRPPGNRTPMEAETSMCLPFLNRTIEILEPRFIVCLGATPTQRLTGRTDGILKLRGKWLTHRVGDRDIPLLATLHPAYLLRQPSQKRLSWRDLLSLREALDAH
jgi:uracil-DNA glycosylase